MTGGERPPARVVHAPAIEAHRLLGDDRSAALLLPDATIDWWRASDFASRSSWLVRLVRAVNGPVTVEYELRLGGLDNPARRLDRAGRNHRRHVCHRRGPHGPPPSTAGLAPG